MNRYPRTMPDSRQDGNHLLRTRDTISVPAAVHTTAWRRVSITSCLDGWVYLLNKISDSDVPVYRPFEQCFPFYRQWLLRRKGWRSRKLRRSYRPLVQVCGKIDEDQGYKWAGISWPVHVCRECSSSLELGGNTSPKASRVKYNKQSVTV